jgi:putative ABC transport system substrate-binding protein
MNRRDFIAALGGAAAWPLAAGAQQGGRVRRIGVLVGPDENDPVSKTKVSAFTQALAGLGWTDGRNVRMDLRWGAGDTNRIRAFAQELVGLRPDIILAGTTPATVALQRETRTIPIVFAGVADPVASGIVPGLNQPSGNITGFANLEATLGGKWLELLSEIAPGLKRAAIMFNPDTTPASTFMPSLETAAHLVRLGARAADIDTDVAQMKPAPTATKLGQTHQKKHDVDNDQNEICGHRQALENDYSPPHLPFRATAPDTAIEQLRDLSADERRS